MSNYKNNDNQGQLQRQLSPTHVWAIALGALVMIIIAFSYAYMVPKYPKAGGEFTFTKMCFGRNTLKNQKKWVLHAILMILEMLLL